MWCNMSGDDSDQKQRVSYINRRRKKNTIDNVSLHLVLPSCQNWHPCWHLEQCITDGCKAITETDLAVWMTRIVAVQITKISFFQTVDNFKEFQQTILLPWIGKRSRAEILWWLNDLGNIHDVLVSSGGIIRIRLYSSKRNFAQIEIKEKKFWKREEQEEKRFHRVKTEEKKDRRLREGLHKDFKIDIFS